MLSDYKLKIGDLFSFPAGNVKNLEPNYFDKEKHVFIMKT